MDNEYLSELEAMNYVRWQGKKQSWRNYVTRQRVPRFQIGRYPLYLRETLDELIRAKAIGNHQRKKKQAS